MTDAPAPIVVRETPALSTVGSYTENLRAHQFSDWISSLSALLGFDTASFTLHGDELYLEQWFQDGLGRQITRYAPDGQFMIWQGFVDELTLVEPGLQSTVGLTGLANKVKGTYVTVDPSTNPPTISAGTRAETAYSSDTDSQARYGVHEEIISLGETTATLAGYKVTRHLNLLAWPQPDDVSGQGAPGEAVLRVRCKGWGHSLAWRHFTQTTASGTQNASAEVSDILTSCGEFVATSVIDTNTAAITKYMADDRRALDILKAICSLGDASGNRWIMPVLEERTLYYRQARTAVDYLRRVTDNRLAVYDGTGRLLPPWEVRPDHWLRTTDVFPFQASDPASLLRDPQARYIERVEWTEPWGLSLYGTQRLELPALDAASALPGTMVV